MDSSGERCCPFCGKHFPSSHEVTTEEKNNGLLRRSPRMSSIRTDTKALNTSDLPSGDTLCSDCTNDVHLMAMEADNDNDYSNDDDGILPSSAINAIDASLSFSCDVSSCIPTDEQCETPHYHEQSVGRKDSINSRIVVSPESSKTTAVQSTTCSKICIHCTTRMVQEEWMDYCKHCYALGARDTGKQKNVITGRCRYCSGKVNDISYEFCQKCYLAKQRDDSKRIEKDLYQKLYKNNSNEPMKRIPYVCMDCGNKIHDCSWKTKCPPCYATFRKSEKGKPKLIKSPIVYKTKRSVTKKRNFR